MKNLFKNLKKSFTSKIHSTTILAIKKNNKVVIIGDGQVTQGSVLIKSDARKIRELKKGIISGFAGSLADCLTLTQELERYIENYAGFPLIKPCIELAVKWRTEKNYKNLEASILVVSNKDIIELDGQGNVLIHEKYRALGSGGLFAECATEALYDMDLDPEEIALRAMKIAAKKCIYTNDNFIIKSLYNDSLENSSEVNEFNVDNFDKNKNQINNIDDKNEDKKDMDKENKDIEK